MEGGKNVRLYPVEVGARGFLGESVMRLQKDLWLSQGITRQPGRGGREGKLLALAEEAGQGMWSKQLLKMVS